MRPTGVDFSAVDRFDVSVALPGGIVDDLDACGKRQ
jgi:hypothetical protein